MTDAPKLKSVYGRGEFPKTVHAGQAVLRFPNGTVSGNWESRGSEKTRPYTRADLIDMDVLRRVEEGMAFARNRLEMIADEAWNGDARDFKRLIPSVFSDFDAALTAFRAMMEKINE